MPALFPGTKGGLLLFLNFRRQHLSYVFHMHTSRNSFGKSKKAPLSAPFSHNVLLPARHELLTLLAEDPFQNATKRRKTPPPTSILPALIKKQAAGFPPALILLMMNSKSNCLGIYQMLQNVIYLFHLSLDGLHILLYANSAFRLCQPKAASHLRKGVGHQTEAPSFKQNFFQE